MMEQDPGYTPEEGTLSAAIYESDVYQSHLLELAHTITAGVNDSLAEDVADVANSSAVAYEKVIQMIFTDANMGTQEKARAAASFMVHTHNQRFGNFSSLAKTVRFIELLPSDEDLSVEDDLAYRLEDHLGDETDHSAFSDFLATEYAEVLATDCQRLVDFCPELETKPESGDESRRSQLAQEARNIGGTVMGTAIGGILAGLVLRKLSK